MTAPETNEKRRFVWPSDYYSSATPAPVIPRGVAYGCGGAALLALIVIFVLGAALSGGGFNRFLDMSLGMSLGEMRGMYAAEVTPQRKASLEAEIEKMRVSLRSEKVSVVNLQPFLEGLRSAVADDRVTAQEAMLLEESVRKINAGVRR
jgi:hypothetical protein